MELTAITLTNVVFPEFWSPTRVSSISSFQNRLLNQSTIRLMNANILLDTSHSKRFKFQSKKEVFHQTLAPLHCEDTPQACKPLPLQQNLLNRLLCFCFSSQVRNMKDPPFKYLRHVTWPSLLGEFTGLWSLRKLQVQNFGVEAARSLQKWLSLQRRNRWC